MVSTIINAMKAWAESVILTMGYPGFTLLMFLDAANVPIPSEVIMPFGGILAEQGRMNLHGVALAGTLGSVLGSAFSYWIGSALGKPFLLKYGKWFFIRPQEIATAERWFTRFGLPFTLWGRFIPILRTFVSLPAGLFKANFPVFLLYATLGSLPWCYLWAWLGFKLGKNWAWVEEQMKIIEIIVMVALVVLVVRFLLARFRKPAPEAEANS